MRGFKQKDLISYIYLPVSIVTGEERKPKSECVWVAGCLNHPRPAGSCSGAWGAKGCTEGSRLPWGEPGDPSVCIRGWICSAPSFLLPPFPAGSPVLCLIPQHRLVHPEIQHWWISVSASAGMD